MSSCLCHKILARQYSSITESEAKILSRTWKEAPHLFQDFASTQSDIEPASPQVRKRRRILPNSCSNSLVPSRPQDPNPTLHFAPAPATALEKTYSSQNAARILAGDRLDVQQRGGVYARIYVAIERSDHFGRVCYYAFAKVHKKGTSVDLPVKEVKDALQLPSEVARTKIYHILHVGNKWATIIDQFASVVNGHPQQLTGLLCLLGSASAWERAATGDCRLALSNLHRTTDIHSKTLEVSPFVNKILHQISLETSFVDETHRLTSQPSLHRDTMPPSKPGRSSLAPTAASTSRALHTISEASPAWRGPSLTAGTGSSDVLSNDANTLLKLLSFLAPSEHISLDLLCRGATPRRRWTVQGEIEEVDASHAGLAPEVESLLADIQRLGSALHELELSSAVSKNPDGTYTLDEAAAGPVRESLSAELLYFWRYQALVIAYRAIPWRYIESSIPSIKILLPHLKYALQALQGRIGHLPTSTRIDLALSLVEASRFPNVKWKRFAVGQAELAAGGIEDSYLHSCITESRCLLNRIAGNMDQAVSSLGDFCQDKRSNTVDKRMHSTVGQAVIQQSLNCIQVEELSAARRLLEDWCPLGKNPSLKEEVVLFRKDMMLGRILRFQGDFAESLTHLEKARKTAERSNLLVFDEDLRDLTCDLADTLRELDDPVSAEHHLRAEIARRDQNYTHSTGMSLLELSLAEALFAQGRYEDAERLSLDIQSRTGLLRFERLRVHITLAKIRHVNSEYEDALSCWSEAMKAAGKFRLTNGRTTRVIVISICDTLRCLGHNTLMRDSMSQVAALDKLAKPGGVQYWIAGLRHWCGYLQSRAASSRM